MTNRSSLRRFAAGLAGAAVLSIPGVAAAAMTTVDGNSKCADIAPAGSTWTERKLDFDPDSTTYPFDTFNVTIDKSDETTLSWTSTIDIDAVILKGGNGANVYTYDGETMTGSGLTTPMNDKSGKPYGISHISFCFGDDPVTTSEEPPVITTTNTDTPQTPAAPAPEAQAQAQVLGVVVEAAAAPAAESAAAETPAAQVLGVEITRPALAATGVETGVLATVGSLLVAAGAALLAVGRRGFRRARG